MPERPTSPYSRNLADALLGYMRQRGVTQKAIVEFTGRSTGYVSEHLSGKRPPETDLIDAVASLAGADTRSLVDELNRRIGAPTRQEEPDARDIAEGSAAYEKGRSTPAQPSDGANTDVPRGQYGR